MNNLEIPTISGLPFTEHNFCHFLVSDPQMNETEAYLKINPEIERKSACQQAGRYLAKPEVREYLGKLLEERQKRLQMDEDWVVGRLRDIHDRCMQAEPVYSQIIMKDTETGEAIEPEPIYYKFDAAGATKALELIGKHMKMFSDKTDAGTTNVQVNIRLGYDDKGKEKPAIEGSFKRVGTN